MRAATVININPRVAQVIADMMTLSTLMVIAEKLGDPVDDADRWAEMMCNRPGEWASAVAMLHFSESCVDGAMDTEGANAARPFACQACSATFHTARARDSHARIKHGARAPQRWYAPASGTCPVCATEFRSRLRLLAHLCDSRRTRCWTTITSKPKAFKKLDKVTLDRLDAEDTKTRRNAWKKGHSHAIAVGSARRGDGRSIGRAKL